MLMNGITDQQHIYTHTQALKMPVSPSLHTDASTLTHTQRQIFQLFSSINQKSHFMRLHDTTMHSIWILTSTRLLRVAEHFYIII